jgi:NitT/TauT family transport system substrate-binding protein
MVLALLAAACGPTAPAATPTSPPAAAAPTTAPAASAPSPAAAKPAASPAVAASPAASPAAASASPVAAAASAPKPTGQTVNLPKPEKTSIKLTHSTIEANQVIYPLANDLGLYKKYGLDVELFYNEGDAKSFQAIASGQFDFTAQGASVAVSSLTGDVPLITVAFTATTLTDGLMSTANVKSAADLKGKSVAVSSFGGTSHASVLLSLKQLGLTANDVTIQSIGGQAARIAALKAGSVAAAPIDVALENELKSQGFNVLVRLPDTPAQFARNGMMARRDWAEQNPNTVLAFTAANLEAMQAVFNQTDKAIDSYMKWTQQTDRSKAENDIRDFMKYANRSLGWDRSAFEAAKEVLATTTPEIANVDVTKAYSHEYLKKLLAAGLYASVGAPEPKFP